jgi:Tfp pilus assembly protein PilV
VIRLHGVLRRVRDDEGMGLIELMVSLFILSVAVFALIQLMGSTVIGTLKTRQRETGVALANRTLESIRSNGYANIAMKGGTTPAPPTTYTDNGVTYATLINATCSSCLIYSRSVTDNGFTFTVLQVAIGVDDAQDLTGASDTDANTVDYKRIVVEVQSTAGAPGPSFTYKTQSIVHDVSKDPVDPVQGIHVEIHNPDEDGDPIVSDDQYHWTIAIDGAGVLSDPIDEGVYNNFDLPVGAYTCTVSNTEFSTSWYPQGSPTADSESFACAVTANTVTASGTMNREWQQSDGCKATAGQTGKLWVVVQDENGNPLQGATVDPTPAATPTPQTPDPAAQLSTSAGDAIFDPVPIGPYTVSVSATGRVTQSGLTACVHTQEPTQPSITVNLQLTPVIPTASVNVPVKNTAAGTVTFKVAFENGPAPYEQTQSIGHNITVTYTFQPVLGTYDVAVYCLKGTAWNLKTTKKAQAFTSATTYNLATIGSAC